MIRGSHKYSRFVLARDPDDQDWARTVDYLTLRQSDRRRPSRLARRKAQFDAVTGVQPQKPATGFLGRIKGMFRSALTNQ